MFLNIQHSSKSHVVYCTKINYLRYYFGRIVNFANVANFESPSICGGGGGGAIITSRKEVDSSDNENNVKNTKRVQTV